MQTQRPYHRPPCACVPGQRLQVVVSEMGNLITPGPRLPQAITDPWPRGGCEDAALGLEGDSVGHCLP